MNGEENTSGVAAVEAPSNEAVEEDRRTVLQLLYAAHQREPCGPTLEAITAAIQHLQAVDALGVDVPSRPTLPPEPFVPLNKHSKGYMQALADLVGIPSRTFKGHPEVDWIRREDAMRLVPALRDHADALATMLRKELLRAHGVSRTDAETICHKPTMPPKDRP